MTQEMNATRNELKTLTAKAKQLDIKGNTNTKLRALYKIQEGAKLLTRAEWKAEGRKTKANAKGRLFWGAPVTTKAGHTFYPVVIKYTENQTKKA